MALGSVPKTLLTFMLVSSRNKWDATHAFINIWLKDPRWYCNNCGQNYGVETPKSPFTCCVKPQVGRNIDHTKAVMKQNERIKKTRNNDYASNGKKTLRFGVSLPPMLLADLERYFKKNYNEKLFENKEEMYKFMKKFPQFSIATRV